MATRHLEDLIYQYLRRHLTSKEKMELGSGWDVEKHIDEETESEMQNDLFNYVKGCIVWGIIIRRLQDEIEDADDDDEEEDADDEEQDY